MDEATPKADCGILLVHGIGDHKESETLLSFGEPMMDWLREWMDGMAARSGNPYNWGEARVVDSVLRARGGGDAPAYAVAKISRYGETRTCLLAEAWWGGVVQPPDSLELLQWLAYRGPLLILAHYFLGRDDEDLSEFDPKRAALVLALSFVVQALALLAITAWVIPVDWLRQRIAGTIRTLTLTLGDSFVLLEQEFQHAALLRMVDDALRWLEARVTEPQEVAVVAHSQGAAIAHEVLSRRSQGPRPRVKAFIGLGSGLEKLQFLQHVRLRRKALLSTALMSPVAAVAVGLGIAYFFGFAGFWSVPLAVVLAALSLFFLIAAAVDLSSYRSTILSKLERARPDAGDWVELHATRDLVPMGDPSLLEGLCQRKRVINLRSILTDHVTYFSNFHGVLPILWAELGKQLDLPIFVEGDPERLEVLLRHHAQHSLSRTCCKLLAAIAGFAAAFVFFQPLFQTGRWISVQLEEYGLKAVDRVLAWPAKLLGHGPSSIAPSAVTLAVALALAGGWLWWVAFAKIWDLCALHRWRRACRRQAFVGAANDSWPWLVGLVGLLPVSLVFGVWRGWIRADTTEQLIVIGIGGVLWLMALFFVLIIPVGIFQKLKEQTPQGSDFPGTAPKFMPPGHLDSVYLDTLLFPAVTPIFILLLSWVAHKLVWSAELERVIAITGLLTGINWLVTVFWKTRRDLHWAIWQALAAAFAPSLLAWAVRANPFGLQPLTAAVLVQLGGWSITGASIVLIQLLRFRTP